MHEALVKWGFDTLCRVLSRGKRLTDVNSYQTVINNCGTGKESAQIESKAANNAGVTSIRDSTRSLKNDSLGPNAINGTGFLV